VRNALTGAHISRISTAVGSLDTPSGLAKIATWADSPEKNNTAGYTYGGDLLGNLWRFDINRSEVLKFAVLKDPNNATQPITARPELGLVAGKRIIYVGTGKYLEISDLLNTQRQTLYAIKDENASATLDDARESLMPLTLITNGVTRTVSGTGADFTTDRGWYIDFPDSGERINVDMRLDSGALIAPTTVPSNTVCSPGGYGWLNYFDYRSGTAVVGAENNLVSQKFNAPIVGVNIFRLPNGKRITTVVTADDPTPRKPPKDPGGDLAGSGFVGKRIIWRELNP
jgi:type IV pilus assembly protein PilY1